MANISRPKLSTRATTVAVAIPIVRLWNTSPGANPPAITGADKRYTAKTRIATPGPSMSRLDGMTA